MPHIAPIYHRIFAQKVDELSVSLGKITSLQLMENAGKKVYTTVKNLCSQKSAILVLAGPGGNGGDALVAARHLHLDGFNVMVFLVKPEGKNLTRECDVQIKNLEKSGVTPLSWQQKALKEAVEKEVFDDLLILDGLLGIGLKGELKEGVFLEVLKEAASLKASKILAIDIPSGVDCDRFSYKKIPLKPTHTVTFGGAKPIHLLSPARSLCGKIEVFDIGFDKEAILKASQEKKGIALVLEEQLLDTNPLDQLSQDAHKYDRGHVLVIGGSKGKMGAPIMAGHAALRSGAGWVSVAAPFASPFAGPYDLTFEDFFKDGRLSAAAALDFMQNRKVKSLIVGPGTMTNPLSIDFLKGVKKLMEKEGLFLVIDAGGLHRVFDLLSECPLDPEKTLLTPHPGEWVKQSHGLLPLGSLQELRLAAKMLERYQVSCLYKSATPIFLSPCPKEPFLAFLEGTNALSKAGSGDVLSGAIAACGAMGAALGGASSKAAFAAKRGQALLHKACKLAVKKRSRHGLSPLDLIEALSTL